MKDCQLISKCTILILTIIIHIVWHSIHHCFVKGTYNISKSVLCQYQSGSTSKNIMTKTLNIFIPEETGGRQNKNFNCYRERLFNAVYGLSLWFFPPSPMSVLVFSLNSQCSFTTNRFTKSVSEKMRYRKMFIDYVIIRTPLFCSCYY